MMEGLRHRGPDATGSVTGDNFSIGHCRLAIMDPEKGDRPFYSEDGNLSIVSDARIYNSPALRDELSKHHVFQTTNDSEVILHLYEELGPKAVERLDGMFALCITDGDFLFLARDSLGIKPLYYGKDPRGSSTFRPKSRAFPTTSARSGNSPQEPGTTRNTDFPVITRFRRSSPSRMQKRRP